MGVFQTLFRESVKFSNFQKISMVMWFGIKMAKNGYTLKFLATYALCGRRYWQNFIDGYFWLILMKCSDFRRVSRHQKSPFFQIFEKIWNYSSYEELVISNLGLIKIELKMYPFFSKIFVPMFDFFSCVEFKISKFNRFLIMWLLIMHRFSELRSFGSFCCADPWFGYKIEENVQNVPSVFLTCAESWSLWIFFYFEEKKVKIHQNSWSF